MRDDEIYLIPSIKQWGSVGEFDIRLYITNFEKMGIFNSGKQSPGILL